MRHTPRTRRAASKSGNEAPRTTTPADQGQPAPSDATVREAPRQRLSKSGQPMSCPPERLARTLAPLHLSLGSQSGIAHPHFADAVGCPTPKTKVIQSLMEVMAA